MHLKARRLTFEQKREVAKLLVKRVPRKVISADLNISEASISHIMTTFVLVTLSEKYPDEPKQISLDLEG